MLLPTQLRPSFQATLLLLPSLATSTPFSLRMLSSITHRQQGILSSGASSSVLESGILAKALHAVAVQYPAHSPALNAYLDEVIAVVTPNLTNATRDVSSASLDRFDVANALITKQSDGKQLTTTEAAALSALDASFGLQPRTPEGGIWYFVYPNWSYLDGMFSILPYLASQPSPNVSDIALQINLITEHCVDRSGSGLYVHGYDYSRTAVWADGVTGGSPFVWGRALGWFMGGLVETYEVLCLDARDAEGQVQQRRGGGGEFGEQEHLCALIESTFTEIVPPLLSFADTETGTWFQLPTLPHRPGNLLESSSTELFIWTLLKARRIGMIPCMKRPQPHRQPPSGAPADAHPDDHANGQSSLCHEAVEAALKAYHSTLSLFVTYPPTADGAPDITTLHFNNTVAVNSLNSTANYTYYTTRPIVQDSLLGESAFVLASLEVELLGVA